MHGVAVNEVEESAMICGAGCAALVEGMLCVARGDRMDLSVQKRHGWCRKDVHGSYAGLRQGMSRCVLGGATPTVH